MGFWKGFAELMKESDNLEIRWGENPIINNYYYITINNRVIQVTGEEFKKHIKRNELICNNKAIEWKK